MEASRLDSAGGDQPVAVGDALVVTDRLDLGRVTPERLLETIETTYRRGDGRLTAVVGAESRFFDRRFVNSFKSWAP